MAKTLFASIQEAEDLYQRAQAFKEIKRADNYKQMCQILQEPYKTSTTSREKQYKRWKTAIKFRRYKEAFTSIEILSKEEQLSKVFEMITNDNLFYLMCLTFDLHSRIKPDEPIFYITTTSMALMYGFINSAYLDFSSSIDPEKRKELALKLESQAVQVDTRHLPEFREYKNKVIDNKMSQLVDNINEAIDGDKQLIHKVVEDYLTYDYATSYEPLTDTIIVLKDFYGHTSQTLTYKIISCLNTLHKMGVIYYEPVLMGLKKNKKNKTILYPLDMNQKKEILEMRNEIACRLGYEGYAGVVATKRFSDFDKVFLPTLKEQFGFYKIKSFNAIAYDTKILKQHKHTYYTYFKNNNIDFKLLIDNNSLEFRDKVLNNKKKRDKKNNRENDFQYYLYKLIVNQLLIPDEEDFEIQEIYQNTVDELLEENGIKLPSVFYNNIIHKYNIVENETRFAKIEFPILEEKDIESLVAQAMYEFNENIQEIDS